MVVGVSWREPTRGVVEGVEAEEEKKGGREDEDAERRV